MIDITKFVPKIVYVAYIVTTPEKLWDALTRGEFTKQYFFGLRAESEWKVGSDVKYWRPDGTLDVSGKVMVSEPLKRLCFTWHVVNWEKEFGTQPETLVTFQLDALGDVVRFTVTQSHEEPFDERLLAGGSRGWVIIVNSLKTFLETGKPLPAFDMNDLMNAVEEMKKIFKEREK